jgi:hypothetical protein
MIEARGPISTISPRCITAMRWLMRSTTAMSCEMDRKASPISARMQASGIDQSDRVAHLAAQAARRHT